MKNYIQYAIVSAILLNILLPQTATASVWGDEAVFEYKKPSWGIHTETNVIGEGNELDYTFYFIFNFLKIPLYSLYCDTWDTGIGFTYGVHGGAGNFTFEEDANFHGVTVTDLNHDIPPYAVFAGLTNVETNIAGWDTATRFSYTDTTLSFDFGGLTVTDSSYLRGDFLYLIPCYTDTDGDGVEDCEDQCPEDANKIEPGVCGCGKSDADDDKDGIPFCMDTCPYHSNPDNADADGDGIGNKCDNCKYVRNPYQVDSDGDGYGDKCDECPENAIKTAPGECGCDVADKDSDNDGTMDCNDGCPENPFKAGPGACGCDRLEYDEDGDGVPDCLDICMWRLIKIMQYLMMECPCEPPEDGVIFDINGDGITSTEEMIYLLQVLAELRPGRLY